MGGRRIVKDLKYKLLCSLTLCSDLLCGDQMLCSTGKTLLNLTFISVVAIKKIYIYIFLHTYLKIKLTPLCSPLAIVEIQLSSANIGYFYSEAMKYEHINYYFTDHPLKTFKDSLFYKIK